MSVKPIIAWYDCWVGLYWDRRHRRLYIFPIPCIGVVVDFREGERSDPAERCAEGGHDWKFIGASNAGCSPFCHCSVPVHECRRCGDYDYGRNNKADAVVSECRRMRDDQT